jgi:hypothetical protein
MTAEDWALAVTVFFSGPASGLLGMLCTIMRPMLEAMDGRTSGTSWKRPRESRPKQWATESTLDARAPSRTRYARSGTGYLRDIRRLSRDSTSRLIQD